MDGAKPPSQASASASLAILNTVSRLASGRGRLRDSSRPPAVAPRGVRPRSVDGGRLHDASVHPVPRSGRSGRIPVKRLSCPRNRVRYRRGLSADGALRTGHNAVRHCRPAFAVAEQRCCGCSLHSASAPHARALAGSQPYGPCPHAGRQRSRCGVGSPELARRTWDVGSGRLTACRSARSC